ncbi:MAG TPA: four helix bundle protein [Thermoanaerobaculia bacterium]
MAGFEKLVIWQRAMGLVPRVYRVARTLPRDEIFGLMSQMKRAAISIPSNIAEGYARRGRRDFARFVSNAQGSLAELLTQLLITMDLGYMKRRRLTSIMNEIEELSRMLNATRRKLLIPNP